MKLVVAVLLLITIGACAQPDPVAGYRPASPEERATAMGMIVEY